MIARIIDARVTDGKVVAANRLRAYMSELLKWAAARNVGSRAMSTRTPVTIPKR